MILRLARTLRRKLWRDRRRIVICFVLATLAGALSQWGAPHPRNTTPPWIIAGALYGGVFLAFTIAVVLILPSFRHSLEVVFLGMFVLALLSLWSVEFSLVGFQFGSEPMWFIIACVAFGMLYWSQSADRFMPHTLGRVRYTQKSKLSAEDLFHGMFASPEGLDRLVDRDRIVSLVWEDDAVRTTRMVCRLDDNTGATIEEVRHFDSFEPPHAASFSFDAPNAPALAQMSRGRASFVIEDNGTHRVIRSETTFDRLSLRGRLFIWMDDGLGRQNDERLTSLEIRENVRSGAPTAAPQTV